MSDIQVIIQSVANANDRVKEFLREVKKMPKPEQVKLLGAVEELRDAIAGLSKTASAIKKAVSPQNTFVVAGAKAKAAQQSEELERELGGYENIATPASSIGAVKGREFCVTGEVDGMERKDLQDLIKSRGGKIHGNLTKKLDVLVIGSAPGPTKVIKARERKIKIVQALDLIEWIKQQR